jgi:hypothetical protein
MDADSVVEYSKLIDVSDQLPVLVLLGGKDGFEVDPLPLHLSKHFKSFRYFLEVVLPCLDLILEVFIEQSCLLSRKNAHVVL